jgi:orotate phosphoribosyltransferase
MTKDMKKDLLSLFKRWSFKKGEFQLASGKTSDFYIDVRPVALSAEGHWKLGQLLFEAVHEFDGVDAVAGVELGGCPLASAVAYASYLERVLAPVSGKKKTPPPLSAIYVRKKPKNHGTSKLVEASFPHHNGKKPANVVLVEDVVTTGGSTIRAVRALQEAGHKVVGICVVVDREEGGVREIKLETGVGVRSLFARHDFI